MLHTTEVANDSNVATTPRDHMFPLHSEAANCCAAEENGDNICLDVPKFCQFSLPTDGLIAPFDRAIIGKQDVLEKMAFNGTGKI